MSVSKSNGRASTEKRIFSRQTTVSIDITAKASRIWALLTNASEFPRWNSTVISIEGEIALGKSIRLKSKLAPDRVFQLKVKSFDPPRTMRWGDAMGNRIYSLEDLGNGQTRFTMNEKIGGPIFPLFAKLIPSFDQAFEDFAADLKRAAENEKDS